MAKCIFCLSENGQFNTREHILPESLGGGDWAVLPDGLYCDRCQNRFGSSIEQQALGDYPFSLFRVLMGIPTKRGNAAWLKSWEGILRGSSVPGTIGYDPTTPFLSATMSGKKTAMRVLAEPLKPSFICRTLLKMGLEVIASDNRDDVFDARFDNARQYALTGDKQGVWWYLQREDEVAASSYIKYGFSVEDWERDVKLETVMIDDDAEVFHLKLLFLDMFVPLEQRIQHQQLNNLPEPEYRLFIT